MITIETGQPGSAVFINNVRHGTAGENGDLVLKNIRPGTFPLRVRSLGFADWQGTVSIKPGVNKSVRVPSRKPADEASLHFQRAEQLREHGQHRDAVQEYEQALALRAAFPEARIGMSRSLIPRQDFQEAEKQLQRALRATGRPAAEAQTVLANLRRSQGLYEESVAEYRKAIRLAGGVSAEAHVGLAIALKELGKLDAAVKEYRIGIVQDMDTEPVLYYQLGEILEHLQRNKEAIQAYRTYLRLDPEGEYASAVESIIERLKESSPTEE
jgi:tetratricopeptide (TPR) repeat protein